MLKFYIGGRIGNLMKFEKKRAKSPFHFDQLWMDSPIFLILVRMLPGYVSKFVSVAVEFYQVPMSTNLWTTLVTNLIGAIVMVSDGYRLMQLFRCIN